MIDDERWMRRALDLATRGLGETNPNPAVGCVVVAGGRAVGEGWHRRAGGPHAEVVALGAAGPRARGATLYVTLEPCPHEGRTPPCAPQVRDAGVRRAVVAMRDPNPLVDGRGLAVLRRAGIEVRLGVLGEEAALLNERFVTSVREGRVFVLLKVALTLDGRIATARGDSKWITSPRQRREARAMRRLHDAVAVGIGTVVADDPLLLPSPRVRRPFPRIIFDSRLRIPPASRLVRSARQAPVWVLCGRAGRDRRGALERRGVKIIVAPNPGRVPLKWALRELWRRGIRSLMVEGGAELLGSFLAERLVDQVALFRAPLLLGGRGSLSAFGGPQPARIGQALRLSPVSPLVGRRAPSGALAPGRCELWYPERRTR